MDRAREDKGQGSVSKWVVKANVRRAERTRGGPLPRVAWASHKQERLEGYGQDGEGQG